MELTSERLPWLRQASAQQDDLSGAARLEFVEAIEDPGFESVARGNDAGVFDHQDDGALRSTGAV